MNKKTKSTVNKVNSTQKRKYTKRKYSKRATYRTPSLRYTIAEKLFFGLPKPDQTMIIMKALKLD